tara:strand:+ start:5279 stop:5929 length:651 start_codon:yes stop_codon:yes gene_type:complete
MKPTTIKLIWQVLLLAILLIVFLTSSFIGGSFYPNKWTVDRLEEDFHKKEVDKVALLGLQEPEFEFDGPDSFMNAVGQCVDYINFTTDRRSRVPKSIIIAMAGVESAWGTSRFAKEGNNLFGVRTWDLTMDHMKPLAIPDAKFGLRKYETKCKSIRHMISILNNHPAYEKFREEREKQIKDGSWNYPKLLEGLKAWSTNEKYTKMIYATIVDRKLP